MRAAMRDRLHKIKLDGFRPTRDFLDKPRELRRYPLRKGQLGRHLDMIAAFRYALLGRWRPSRRARLSRPRRLTLVSNVRWPRLRAPKPTSPPRDCLSLQSMRLASCSDFTLALSRLLIYILDGSHSSLQSLTRWSGRSYSGKRRCDLYESRCIRSRRARHDYSFIFRNRSIRRQIVAKDLGRRPLAYSEGSPFPSRAPSILSASLRRGSRAIVIAEALCRSVCRRGDSSASFRHSLSR
jgi:hypothetical protein